MFLLVGVIIIAFFIWVCSTISKHAGPLEGVLSRLLAPILVPIGFIGICAVLLALMGY